MQAPTENSEYLKTDSFLVSQQLAHTGQYLVGSYEVLILLNVMI